MTAERSIAEFFEQAVTAGGEPKRVCNLLTQIGLKLANESGCSLAGLGFTAEKIAELAKMIEAGDVSASAANTIMPEMLKSDHGPGAIAEQLNLVQKSDAGELEVVVDEVLAANEKAVADAKADDKKSKKAIGFLLGQVMQKTRGQANPKIVSQILIEKLKA